MKIPKPSEADKETFRHLVPDGVEIKPMFGNLAAFVNGNMFMGLFGPHLGVQLSDGDAATLEERGGTRDFGPEGRPMKKYVRLPDGWSDDVDGALVWAEKALEHVAAMPPKAKKK